MQHFVTKGNIHTPSACLSYFVKWGIHADIIVYIFAHLRTTLHPEENFLHINLLQASLKS